MRLISLDVNNIRGIKNISIAPNEENMVIYGPNGTGKSAIVDAIDFLLTGKIARLTGEGAGVLSLKEHGCHIDSRDHLENTEVKAKVKIGTDEITLERSINKPSTLIVEPKEFEQNVRELLSLAELGQHLLTRRDILQYITAEAGRRAKKVISLLDLDKIESLRQTFVSLNTETSKESEMVEVNIATAKLDLATLLEIDPFSEGAVLAKVNEKRQKLGGAPITKLSVEEIKKDLTPHPFDTLLSTISDAEIIASVGMIRKFFENSSVLYSSEKELVGLLEEVVKNKTLRKCVIYETLIKAGINLVDESNECPLCGRKWENGDFIDYLIEKEKEANIGREKQQQISQISQGLTKQISTLQNLLTKCNEAHKQFKLETINVEELDDYLSGLSSWKETLSNPLDSYEKGKWSNLETALTSLGIEDQILKPLDSYLTESKPKASPEQIAWDDLTKCQERWRVYEVAVNQKQKSDLFKKRASVALTSFEDAMNSELEALYDAVQTDFDKQYKMIHGSDESKFSSKIAHAGAELKFEVDFYQRGKFPPHALHSEGHQDSMGIALFFALNAYLIKNEIDVIVLDDVIQSIDSGHRRGVCELLKSFQATRQLIITTHDSAWAKQLQSQGIVKRDNMVHFANWNVDTGPIYELEKDLWNTLDDDLNKDQVPIAAARLRRNLEYFFCEACDGLGATIRYHGFHQWDLGEYAAAAMGTYKKHLGRAKNNARKMGDEAKLSALEELDKKSSNIFQRSQIEQWIINENVHYNKWDTFSKQDFLPLIAAYKDLFSLFSCQKCGQPIRLNEIRGENPSASINCKCGTFFWNIS